jgi:hypothetical protein
VVDVDMEDRTGSGLVHDHRNAIWCVRAAFREEEEIADRLRLDTQPYMVKAAWASSAIVICSFAEAQDSVQFEHHNHAC